MSALRIWRAQRFCHCLHTASKFPAVERFSRFLKTLVSICYLHYLKCHNWELAQIYWFRSTSSAVGGGPHTIWSPSAKIVALKWPSLKHFVHQSFCYLNSSALRRSCKEAVCMELSSAGMFKHACGLYTVRMCCQITVSPFWAYGRHINVQIRPFCRTCQRSYASCSLSR